MNELVPTMSQSSSIDLTSEQPSDEVQQEGGGETADFSYLDGIKSEVMNLLNSCNEGKSILSSFKSNNGVLNHIFRRRLCHFIINNELSEDAGRRVPPERLYNLACQIKKVFPKEHISTYYTPYSNYGPGLRKPPKGKLWDLLCNRKREYRKSGLITRQVRRAWQPETQSPENPSSSS